MKKLRLWTVTLLLLPFLFLPLGTASDLPFADVPFDVNNIPEPAPPSKEVRDFFDLDPFYEQWINVEGFPVLASAIVSPYAMKEAAWLLKQMIGHRSDFLKALAESGYYFTVSAYNEVLSDIPEFPVRPASQFYYDADSSGWVCESRCRTIVVNESDILGSSNLIPHEMAHAIHLLVFGQDLHSTFDNRLNTLYNAAMEKGLWLGVYAATNRYEYWAVGVEIWFNVRDYPFVQTREGLKAYDPSLAQLIAEVFGDHDWRFTPIQTRTHLPHLQGFDPQLAPLQEVPSDIVEARKELRDPAIEERNEWVNLPPYDPSLIPRLNESRTKGGSTVIFFVNGSDNDVFLYWVLSDGTESFITRIPFLASPIRALYCGVGELLVAKDTTGRNIAVFQAVEKAGRAFVGPTLNLITSGLSKISGDNQSGVAGAVLANPFVVEVREENLSVLEGISVTFTVTADDGTLSDTHTTTDENGRAESTLTLGTNVGTTTVSVSAAGIEHPVTFNAVAEAALDIPDPNLRAAVETVLGKAKDDPITPSEMATLTRLEAGNANISDLTGLEFATNLTSLHLGYGGVEKNSNAVKDLSPLTDLTQLTWLHIPGNSISDISAVAGLTNLTWLNLWDNSISDISPVAGLTKLTDLYLGDNNISDSSPLVANTGLGNGDTVNVRYNPLSYQSIHTHIPALQSRGVIVESNNQAHPALLKISGDDQKGASFASLSQPFVVEAQDANGSVLAGISVTFAVTAGGGTLNTTIIRTDENGRAQSTLTLGPNLGTNTVEVSAAGIEVPATFHAVSDTEAPSIAADVNNDGSVNVLDLVVIASELGNTGINLAVDVNGDGVINVLDLILVAGMFEGAAAAPSAQPQVPETLTAVEVQGWLTDARGLEVKDPIMKRGFLVLEQLLLSLTPKETELLSNYPNPFNPETWIPYRLAEDANVTLTIYDLSGRIVRTLNLGHRIASAYGSRSKAIHWDGRNDLGEQVASGIYFYTLTAGDFSATRRMVILK